MKSVSSEAQVGSLWSVSSTPVPKRPKGRDFGKFTLRRVVVAETPFFVPFYTKFRSSAGGIVSELPTIRE